MKIKQTLFKTGNSLAVVIPAVICKSKKLEAGDKIEIIIEVD